MAYIMREGGDVKIGVEKLPDRKKPSLCVWYCGFKGDHGLLPVASFKDETAAYLFMEALEHIIPIKAME